MTYSQLCNIETVMQRAVNAANHFASIADRDHLSAGMYLLAEVRNAGMYLCDPNTSEERRGEILEILAAAISGSKP